MKNKASDSVKMTIYVPKFIHLLAKVIANKNGEPLATFIKRIIITGVEMAASSSFKASNALNYALKHNQVSTAIKDEVIAYLSLPKSDEEDEEDEEYEEA